jgi:hypothetical protein
MSHDLLVENLMKDGTSSSMIRRWISKTFQWQAQEANKLFNKLGQEETLKDFFKRFEQHCISQRANDQRRLVLLPAFISLDEVRPNIEESLVYHLPWEEVKKAWLRDFSSSSKTGCLKNWKLK